MTTESETRQLARSGYVAYAETTGGKNFRGEPMPEFDSLPEKQRDAWMNAASAIADAAGRRAMKLKAALVYMIGTENIQELKEMEKVLRSGQATGADTAAALNAVQTMIEVLESC